MTREWSALYQHWEQIKARPILSLFEDDNRFQAFSAESDGMLLDYSKTSVDATARDLLLDLARAANLGEKRDAMFAGDKVNRSEDRAALHSALRAPADARVMVDGQNVIPDVMATRARMAAFCDAVRSGQTAGATGRKFSDVVNIGIGGSDLGPAMATRALWPYHDGPRVHFVSNTDPADISDTLALLDAKRTLVIIVSKTFTTLETMTNARVAINWLEQTLGQDAPQHLAAVSSATDKTAAFGISPRRVFGFADWVGGRYSLWGPVGLALMLAIGPKRFDSFLKGGHAMDRHFQCAPLAQNLPVLLGLLGIWHNNICGYSTRAILPYDQHLSRLPAYFQQLDMESNGKCVTQDGTPVKRSTGPIVWGEPGTNGQHAFYQLLHQGTHVVPAEFLIAARGHAPALADQHQLLQANCLAQSEALMRGRSTTGARALARQAGVEGAALERQAAERSFPGNRPSLTLIYPQLTPFVLGQIIALYEHRVFTEATIWDINPFDQWGVELGKTLALDIASIMAGEVPATDKDASTRGLIEALRRPDSPRD